MPLNAKELRRRIKGFTSTQKITKALEMVAAARVRRAQQRVAAARPYSLAIREMFAGVTLRLADGEVRSPLLVQREIKRVALVVITGDKGLSGAYNSNVLRLAVTRIREWQAQGAEPRLIVLGTKGVQFFRRSDFEIVSHYTGLPSIPSFTEAQVIVEELTRLYGDAQVDKVELVYTHFHSMARFTPEQIDLLPATLPEQDATAPAKASADYLFEPSAEAMVEALIPRYLETVIYQGLLESTASQLASQMAAMGAASKNAGELIGQLTLILNKARQAAITQEILEVVGGAEALKA